MKRVFICTADFDKAVAIQDARKKQKRQEEAEEDDPTSTLSPSSSPLAVVEAELQKHEIDTLERCILEILNKKINKVYFDACGCIITQEEKVNLFLADAMKEIDRVELRNNFLQDVKQSMPFYDITLVSNILKMIKCDTHMRKLREDNYHYFKDKLMDF